MHEVLVAALDTAGESFADRLRSLARAYVGFATENAALLDLMYTVKHDPAASADLIAAGQRMVPLVMGMIADGQQAGEVREGPVERVGLPIFSTMHGFADLAVSNMLSAEDIESGLDDVIAYALRGCAP